MILLRLLKTSTCLQENYLLKSIPHKNGSNQSGINSLMQLSMVECRELRDLLLDEVDTISPPITPPSSPTPLLEAADQMMEAADQRMNLSDSFDHDIDDSLTPKISHLRFKSKVFLLGFNY